MTHINKDGEFQSDKYPTCPAGKVPLSVKDATAQDLLWEYARRRRAVDAEFAADLETCLLAAGYAPARGAQMALTNEQLDGLELWDRDPEVFKPEKRPIWAMLVRAAVAEIRRHRSTQRASDERVREVVRLAAIDALTADTGGEAWDDSDFANLIAINVAAQLSQPAPANLSAEERDVVLKLYLMVPIGHMTPEQKLTLDRLLGGGR